MSLDFLYRCVSGLLNYTYNDEKTFSFSKHFHGIFFGKDDGAKILKFSHTISWAVV